MGMFQNKLCKMVPVIKRSYRRSQKVVNQLITIIGSPEEYYEVPYLDPVKRFCECCDNMVDKRVFLITEEENVGLKAAFGILNYPIYSNWEEICEQIEDAGYPLEHLEVQNSQGKPVSIRYVSMNDYSLLRTEDITLKDVVYFAELGEDTGEILNFENRLESILSCDASLQFVQLQKEQLSLPWVQKLMKNMECEVVHLPNVSNDYYEQVLRLLLEGERYRLEEELQPEVLIRNIRKKCGNKFGEEDIAWSLDQAIKSVRFRDGGYVLTMGDFAFDDGETVTALRRMESMIGLNAMKELAFEYAAFSREQMRNARLVQICKHAIFKGKPGTGKTMCGQILAQVMAEHGQSNGAFVVADRQSVIGTHVGQTAPKVAKLFTQARNGVLFVDEAGFLLHDDRASYNQEAVKEFVRYMELYQDVTVIFALYPHEVEAWLQLDAGLSSRISRIVEFADYTEQELVDIAGKMCEQRGYLMEETVRQLLGSYIKGRKILLGELFGNAREIRKLVEAAIFARSIRCYENVPEERKTLLTKEDFENGMKRLKQEDRRKVTRIGFVADGGNK